jgi:phosphatidylglycerol:prolipoprotein diacylglycerol transferase
MLPILQVGPLALPTYPLALMLAFWTALAAAARLAVRGGLDGDHLYNAGLYGLVAAVIGGRAAHVIVFWSAYATQPTEIIGLNTRAFLWEPGIVMGIVAAGMYVYRYRLSASSVLDAAAPAVLIGIALAAGGALLDGRALGAPADLPWAIEVWGVRRYPSQLYEAAAALLAAVAALRTGGLWVRPGTAAWTALLGWGLGRWLLEPFRAESALLPGGFRLAQVVGLAVALVAWWALRSRRAGVQPVGGR